MAVFSFPRICEFKLLSKFHKICQWKAEPTFLLYPVLTISRIKLESTQVREYFLLSNQHSQIQTTLAYLLEFANNCRQVAQQKDEVAKPSNGYWEGRKLEKKNSVCKNTFFLFWKSLCALFSSNRHFVSRMFPFKIFSCRQITMSTFKRDVTYCLIRQNIGTKLTTLGRN